MREKGKKKGTVLLRGVLEESQNQKISLGRTAVGNGKWIVLRDQGEGTCRGGNTEPLKRSGGGGNLYLESKHFGKKNKGASHERTQTGEF